ncbi:MAG: hypothetical protein A2848_00110 [Candidatus Magasanikbacteria bacterium RIFCSPHIGHO2_01_FULL_50_8]|uniref:Uncharacterized protein n=2 Tax=Candidatus Magasanikiibacteriota TaxID=1752731 RepID=A0A1F6LSK1_9BACT|nr:MAG: hypothetical protein A2848_00110 [Candidatus Magasanikbacteria bacterium RIFCSPHIGHO2_01_FULL_50_8]OGH67904.1 MAG: hypothetical protein A3C15_01740 [Candidatus Magasanikbacteria bacterium RIFCSPHIGHO2_02_FULL_50_9b]
MPRKGGSKKITLASIMDSMQSMKKEMQSMKKEILERFDTIEKEHEVYFTSIQDELVSLRKDVDELKQDLKDFRAETNSFHKGFSAKSGRQDATSFKLIGILNARGILSEYQAAELRTI